MAQVGIREFDAKNMYFQFIGKKYSGYKIENEKHIKNINPKKKYVIKPDMLFGKRGKYGLVGVGLNKKETITWFHEKFQSNIDIQGTQGLLDIFIVEEFIPHIDEYYISFSSQRDFDLINFSSEGGVDIEENWEKVQSIKINTLDELKVKNLENIDIYDEKIQNTIISLWNFYKQYGFVYLEVNPFCFHEETGDLVLLDMVGKVDDQEFFKQKNNWNSLDFPNTFGFNENEREKYIKKLDQETGASLKMKILNKNAKIWTLLAGGGGSLVITDTLGSLGCANEIGNYGELSGNPNKDFTKAYARTLIEQMLENKIVGKYLIIAGAIANFTDIQTTFAGIIDILEEKQEEIRDQNIKILIRRGGINEKQGLQDIQYACEKLDIPCIVSDSSEYMTDILEEITI